MYRSALTTFGLALAVIGSLCSSVASAEYQPVIPVAGSMPADSVAVVESTFISAAKFDILYRMVDADVGNPLEGKQRRKAIDTVMRTLVEDRWLRLEAAANGIAVADAEVLPRYRRIKRETFADAKSFREFLEETGQEEADLIDLVRGRMLAERLHDQWTKGVDVSRSEVSRELRKHRSRYLRRHRTTGRAMKSIRARLLARKRKARVDAGYASIRVRWKPATMCRPGYESVDCGSIGT